MSAAAAEAVAGPESRFEAGFGVERIPMAGGGELDLSDPAPTLCAIANGLAQTMRWCRQAPYPYSVAQHSVLLFRYVREAGRSRSDQLAALWHDASEFLWGDEPPFSRCCPQREEQRLALQEATLQLAGITGADLVAIKHLDRQLQWDELAALFPEIFEKYYRGQRRLNVVVDRWSFERSRQEWFDAAFQLHMEEVLKLDEVPS